MSKELSDEFLVICDILNRAEVLWLALIDTDGPYCVPVSFAQIDGVLYIHSGKKGRKAALLQSGASLAFSAAVDIRKSSGGKKACQQGYSFRSVAGKATPRLVTGDEKMAGLDALTLKQVGETMPYIDSMLPATLVFALDVSEITARVRK